MSDPSPDAYADAGGYPIGMVATLTGLPTDVIRAWERRYGLPRPARSIGGHRLYSPRDVTLLRRAAALRAQGLPAGAACAQARAEAAPPAPVSVRAAGSAGTVRLSTRLHAAARALDAAQVGAVLAEAAALLDVATLWRQVVAPALQRLGTDWAQGTHTPAPEHLLSTAVRGRLAALLEAAPRVPGAPRALLGAGPGERHDLAALMLAVLVSQAGWSVTYLGAETPAAAWEEAIRALHPRVVVVAATMPAHAPVVLATLQRLQECFGRQTPQLAYGGPAFASSPLEVGAATGVIRLADDLESAVRQLAAYG